MLMQSVSRGVITRFLLGLLVVVGISSCGSTSNNNQGTIFTLLGVFEDSTCATPAAEFSVPLGDTSVQGSNADFGGGLQAGLQVQSNLAAQGLRVDSVNLNYEIPGASSNPPSTVVALPVLLGPAGDGGVDSSLPGSFSTIDNVGCGRVSVIPAAVEAWLILNKAGLPEAPFTMIVEAVASGVSTAGDRFSTNNIFFTVVYTPGTEIIPTGPTGDGDDDGETA